MHTPSPQHELSPRREMAGPLPHLPDFRRARQRQGHARPCARRDSTRLFHFACGDVFRSLDTRSKLGKAFLEYSSRGELVPAELTIELWKVQIENSVEAHRFKPELDYLVLDGIPRNVEQARAMKPLIKVCKVFHLTCPNRNELLRRLKKRALKDNRLDDANDSRHPPAARRLRGGKPARAGLLWAGPRADHRRPAAAGARDV